MPETNVFVFKMKAVILEGTTGGSEGGSGIDY